MIINHPFIDGNKRMGYILMRLILIENNKDINASQEEKYEFVIGISSGKLKLPEIKLWITSRIIDKNKL